MARTINSPGVEIKEVDLSQNSSIQAGTSVLVQGFAAQGPTNELINVTTKSELSDVYFGGDGPTNAAERYFYHSCSEVLDSTGTLYTVRLPYGASGGDGFNGPYVALAFEGKEEAISLSGATYPASLMTVNASFASVVASANAGYLTFVPSGSVSSVDLGFVDTDFEALIEAVSGDGSGQSSVFGTFAYNTDASAVSGLSASYASGGFGTEMTIGDTVQDVSTFTDAALVITYINEWVSTGASGAFPFSFDVGGLSSDAVYSLGTMLSADALSLQDAVIAEMGVASGDFSISLSATALTYASGGEATAPYSTYTIFGQEHPFNASADAIPVADMLCRWYESTNHDTLQVATDVTGVTPETSKKLTITDCKAVGLTESDLEKIAMGKVVWAAPASAAPVVSGFDTLGNSLFFVVNNMQSNLNEKFEGFYVTVTDQNPFLGKLDAEGNPLLGAVKGFDYVNEPVSHSVLATIDTIPSGKFGVSPATFENSLIKNLSMDFSSSEYAAGITLTVSRMKTYATSNDPNLLYDSLTEQFAASMDAEATHVNEVTKATESFYFEDIINNNSSYLKCYANTNLRKQKYRPTETIAAFVDPDDDEATVHGYTVSLGSKVDCEADEGTKYVGNVAKKIENALTLVDNVLNLDLDIVCDGGLSTIYTYTAIQAKIQQLADRSAIEFDDTFYIDSDVENYGVFIGDNAENAAETDWYLRHRTIFNIFNTFCATTRKDCVFISDPLRAIFVRGTDTKTMDLEGSIFSIDIARAMKNLYNGTNSNYACTYVNWVKKTDVWSDQYIWLPMSAFEAAVMCKTDGNFYPWYAPAFLNRGVLSTILDIAVRPNSGQCDVLYKSGLNPVCFFNGDGFVVWGQKTLQAKSSAFDRINVRRLFLVLERATMKAMRYFIGENNTPFTRTRVLNVLGPIFDVPLNNEGLYDYRLVCDTSNNTSDVIDANEMHVSVYLKAARTSEFIIVTFYATRTDANFDELIG